MTHQKSATVAQSPAAFCTVLSVLTCSDSAGYSPLRLSVYSGLPFYSLSCKMKVNREVKQMMAHDKVSGPAVYSPHWQE